MLPVLCGFSGWLLFFRSEKTDADESGDPTLVVLRT